MHITIGKPCAVSERGGRINNEDALYPQPERVTAGQRLFMVCDGVGGAERGEVASALACESMQTYFSTFLSDSDPTPAFIQKAIAYTEATFSSYTKEHPEATGMATTLTLAYIGSSGITMAHIGDSRIYYLRKGEILFRTEDHSLVNSLVRIGEITEEQARTHPRKNVILRAIQGVEAPTEADVATWEEAQAGDYLFLCTDGVLERVDDEALSAIFRGASGPADIKEALLAACDGKSRDNFSFYIIPIQKVSDNTGVKQNILSFLYSFV